MKSYINHDIDSNARFSAQCSIFNNVVYAKLKPLDDTTKLCLEKIYSSLDSDISVYPTISCRVFDNTFMGINSMPIDVKDILIGRYVEGIPILKFYIDKNKTLRVKLEGFLVDHIQLRPIETLKLKINTLYNSNEIIDFNRTLDIVLSKEQILMPDITIPHIPDTFYPNLTVPQSIAYAKNML